MSFDEFYRLFQKALEIAAINAEKQLHRKLPTNTTISLHGAGHSGYLMDPLNAAKKLYLGEEKFYRIIDVSVIKVTLKESVVFIRASSHMPSTFDETWNDPPGSGPFKQLITKEIDIED